MVSRVRSRPRARARARSRSLSFPPTPKTPSDPGRVSDEDEFLVMPFFCKVIMKCSGKELHSFNCNHLTSLGSIRAGVQNIFEERRNEGSLPELDSIQLFRGERICSNDDIKIHEIFTNLQNEDDCVLAVAMNQKIKKQPSLAGYNRQAIIVNPLHGGLA